MAGDARPFPPYALVQHSLLPRPVFPSPNRYRDTPSSAIIADLECWRWDLAELSELAESASQDLPELRQGIDFARWVIGECVEELERRERLRSRPESPKRIAGAKPVLPSARELKARHPLSRFVPRYFGEPLLPSGRQLRGYCPLPDHVDERPSFYVDPEKDLWHCFGCNRGGDIFTLIAVANGQPHFADMVAFLAGLEGGGA